MNQKINFVLATFFLASVISLGYAQPVQACSSASSSATGLGHGSEIFGGSVTVCVASNTATAGSSSTITKTTKVVVKQEPKPKAAPKPQGAKNQLVKPKPVSTPKPLATKCPTASQLASLPKSADAAERWVQEICRAARPALAKVSAPAPKPKATPKPKIKTKTITETILISNPGSRSSANAAATFAPNPLTASYFPNSSLAIGQTVRFSANPSLHFRTQAVLGRQAEVEFSPQKLSWFIDDVELLFGSKTSFEFLDPGEYEVYALASYRVRYRLLGDTDWQAPAGSILVRSNLLQILVSDNVPEPSRTLLVGQDCLQQPGAIGCEP